MTQFSLDTVTNEGINFHFIPTDKYKTITIVLKCKAPLIRETVTKRALLPFVLKKGTSKYRSEKQLQMKLDELYGALLHISTAKKGAHHILHFQLEFANEKFIQSTEDVTREALQLLHEVTFSPLIESGTFNEAIVTREKRQLANKINAVYDHKVAYANERLIDEMFANEPFAIHSDGYVDDLEKIDGAVLAKYYSELIRNDRFDMYVLGDFSVDEMKEKVMSVFKREIGHDKSIEHDKQRPLYPTEPKKVIETDKIQQAKLHIGYRTNIVYKDDEYSALQVFNGLFGAFPNSKLFMNVREKHSLAYYIASRVESHAGLLLVYSGVETSEYEKAYAIIEAELEALRRGDFTDNELATVQELIISNIKETLDHPAGTIELLYQQVVGETQLLPDDFIKEIEKVTKDEVVQVAKQIKLDTIYVLAGEVGE